MILSQKAIIDFKKAYFLDFGKEVQDNEAQELGIKLIEFFDLIYKPVPKEVNINELSTKQNNYGKSNR